MEGRLKYISGLVNDWLKFAEAKNAGLLVAVSALLVATANHFPSSSDSPRARSLCIGGCFFLMLGAFICLLSFIPKLNFTWFLSKRRPDASDNLCYFGHIASFSAVDYLNALYDAEAKTNPKRKVEVDLSGQIVINAGIAVRKFRQFTTAAVMTLLGCILLALAACSYLRN